MTSISSPFLPGLVCGLFCAHVAGIRLLDSNHCTIRTLSHGYCIFAPIDKRIYHYPDGCQRGGDAYNDQSIISKKEQHASTVEHCENSFNVVSQRPCQHYS